MQHQRDRSVLDPTFDDGTFSAHIRKVGRQSSAISHQHQRQQSIQLSGEVE